MWLGDSDCVRVLRCERDQCNQLCDVSANGWWELYFVMVCNSSCSARVNVVSEWPLVVNERKCMDRIRDIAPPQGAASRRSYIIQEGGGAEAEQGEGRRARSTWKWSGCGSRQSRQSRKPGRRHELEPTRAERTDLEPTRAERTDWSPPGRSGWNWSPPGRSGQNWSPPGRSGRDWSPPGRSRRDWS